MYTDDSVNIVRCLTFEFGNYGLCGKSILKSSTVDTKFMTKWCLGIGEDNKCTGASAFEDTFHKACFVHKPCLLHFCAGH